LQCNVKIKLQILVTTGDPKRNICRSVELNEAQEVYSENARSTKERQN
jgi:hypothetical protein